MATLQQRGNGFRVLYLWHGKRHSLSLGKVRPDEANAKASQVDYLLMRLGQRLLTLPDGCDIETFLKFDGRPPMNPTGEAQQPKRTWRLEEFTDAYLASNEASLEASTVRSIRRHFKHLFSTFGKKFPVAEINLAELQKHVDRRAKVRYHKRLLNPRTIRKEIISLRTAWNWGVRMEYLTGRYPAKGLRYPKADEQPHFMTRAQIQRRIDAGAKSKELWHSLFLTVDEMHEMLAHVKVHARFPALYPMFCFAAHTGARKSELLRAEVSDVDLDSRSISVRERKRVHGTRSTRRVPMSPFLTEVLTDWLAIHPGGVHLFCRTENVLHCRATQCEARPINEYESQHFFEHVLRKSPWQVVRGWHVLRHSFISACVMKGTDQRLIDSWVGHCTDEQRRRYTHLYPAVEQQAIRGVFG
jgi:integrase